uniref:DNA helicase n=1 Tax=Cyprinus carpio TaxID=7962 RepID=A0A8C1WVX6_CYPCA
MAEWGEYYQKEDDESGVFEMFIKGEDGEPSNFDMTMQCVRSVYTSKIISSDKALVALVFYGTEQSKNPRNSFKHVYVYHDLDSPGAKRLQDIDKLQGEKGAQLAEKTMGSGETTLGEALWCCSNLYSDIKLQLSHKRLMIFTCKDDPHRGDSAKDRQARTKAADLKETGVVIDLMHLTKPEGFDVSLFFCDIVSPPEDESELGLQTEPSRKLEDLQKRVRAKELKKRAQSRTAYKPPAVRLYRDTNEPVRTKTRYFHAHNEGTFLPNNMKRAQVYGKKQIKFDDPGLVLMGFKSMERLKLHHHIRPALFIYREEEQISGRSSFVDVLHLFQFNPSVFVTDYFHLFESFHVIFLPFADDIRTVDAHVGPTASDEQVDKMKEIVHKLPFKYRSDAFENPMLQQHYRNLEALALDMLAPEPIEDLTMPKVQMMDDRLGPLVQEFKDLVYPPDYNPEGYGGAEKKPKVEMSEEELKNHVEKGTLGKLTVPVLKDACRQFGIRTTGTKKQELIDALTMQFSK